LEESLANERENERKMVKEGIYMIGTSTLII
jgi:hypothetical protein